MEDAAAHDQRGQTPQHNSGFISKGPWKESANGAKLPYLTRNDLPEADRVIWDEFVKVRGTEPGNIHRTIANAPNLLRRFVDLANELRDGTQLDPKLRELALITVGRLTGAEYEFVHHWNMALGSASGAGSWSNSRNSNLRLNSIRMSVR